MHISSFIHSRAGTFLKRTILSFVFLFTILIAPVQTARADCWGCTYIATAWKYAAEEIRIVYRGAVTGAFKVAVGNTINQQITNAIGGGGDNGPMFIVNWETFLIADPQKKANTYMNDFFSQTLRGRNTSTYQQTQSLSLSTTSRLQQEGIVKTAQAAAESATQPLYDKNYYKYLAQSAIDTINPQPVNMNLMSYASSPSDIFDQGSWRGFSSYFTNPANNHFGYSQIAQNAYRQKISEEQRKADIQAVAYQGFKASETADGIVKTPGSTIANLVSKAQGFSFDSITSAQDFGTLISSGVASAASLAITNAVQTGLNQATDALSDVGDSQLAFELNDNALADTNWNANQGFDSNGKSAGTNSSDYITTGISTGSDPGLDGGGGTAMDPETAACIKNAGNSDKYECRIGGKRVIVINPNFAGETFVSGCAGKPNASKAECSTSSSITNESYAIRLKFTNGLDPAIYGDTSYRILYDTRDTMYDFEKYRSFQMAVSSRPGDFTSQGHCAALNGASVGNVDITDTRQDASKNPFACRLKAGATYYINIRPTYVGCKQNSSDSTEVMCSVFVRDLVPGSGQPAR